QGRTLREVSSAARVSLGYLSEVERGQKEASSELLSSICTALSIPMSVVLREVSDQVAIAEGVAIPDTIPADFLSQFGRDEDLAAVGPAQSGRRLAGAPARSATGGWSRPVSPAGRPDSGTPVVPCRAVRS